MDSLKGTYKLQAHRRAAWERQGGRCRHCLEPISGERVTADHIIPRALGGSRRGGWNIIAACDDCNNVRQTMPIATFIAIIASDIKPSDPKMIPAWERRKANKP